MRRMRTRTIRQAGNSGGRTSTRRTRRGYFERRRNEEDDGREGVDSKEEVLWPISTATSCTPWWTTFPRAMCRRRARFCARWRIQWNWRSWPRRWTTSRRRMKSEPRWRRRWPIHLPTSRLNSSGANGHEASPFRPQAARDLERLPNRERDQVEDAIERCAQTGSGDVKMLAGEGRQLRLRVGDWRVRFIYEKPDIIRILHVRNRREAYR